MRHVPKKKHLVADSLSRRLKYKDDSNNLRKDIKEFLNYKLKCLKIYYLLVTVYEERIKINFGGIKYRKKAFVNTKEGENSGKSSKSLKNDFSTGGNGDYNFTRILNSKLKYSEKY